MAPTEINMVVMAGYSGHALLQLNKLLPMELCLTILGLLRDYNAANPDRPETPTPELEQEAHTAAQTLIEEPDPEALTELRDDLHVRRGSTRKTPKRPPPPA
jgi:hypothetical protein